MLKRINLVVQCKSHLLATTPVIQCVSELNGKKWWKAVKNGENSENAKKNEK